MERYRIDDRVGEGYFGTVTRAVVIESGERVALKRVPLGKLQSGLPNSIIREVKAMQHLLPHRHILTLYEAFAHGSCYVFVTELCDTDLAEVLAATSSRAPMPDGYVKSIMQMLLRALAYCHQNNILHRDVKPANLLFKDGVLKLGDFGLARPFRIDAAQPMTHEVATRWYRAPELLFGSRRYDGGVDVWAAGCIFAELLNGGSVLFPGTGDIDQVSRIFSVLGTPTEQTWPGVCNLPDWNKIVFAPSTGVRWDELMPNTDPLALDLLSKLLCLDPAQRIHASDALCHPYFLSYPLPVMPHSLRLPVNERAVGPIAANHVLLTAVVQGPPSPDHLTWPSSPTSLQAPLLTNYRAVATAAGGAVDEDEESRIERELNLAPVFPESAFEDPFATLQEYTAATANNNSSSDDMEHDYG